MIPVPRYCMEKDTAGIFRAEGRAFVFPQRELIQEDLINGHGQRLVNDCVH